MNEYNQKKPMELEPYFSRHMLAMTGEDLHSKSDIAMELAYRDKVIDSMKSCRNCNHGFYHNREIYPRCGIKNTGIDCTVKNNFKHWELLEE